jgi:hypothetical protein
MVVSIKEIKLRGVRYGKITRCKERRKEKAFENPEREKIGKTREEKR